MSHPLPLETQTLLAELLERLRLQERARRFSHLEGGFAQKTVGGTAYWYFRTSEGPAGQREFYLGPDDAATQALMAAYRDQREAAFQERSGLERLASMLRSGGAILTDGPSARVIQGLAVAGVFRLGGVLVGTHAFLALGNVLGVRWSSTLRTQDVDIAAPRRMEVALPGSESLRQADVPKALDALQMGFLPVPGFDPRSPHTAFKVRGKELRVDLLTPGSGRSESPVSIPRFAAAAQPLRYLDYLLENPIEAAILHSSATLVRVPDPARFALHKLIVADQRPVVEQAKAAKDRAQAADLITTLHHDRPGDLDRALEAIHRRPAAWLKKLRVSAKKIEGLEASLAKRLAKG